VNLATKSTDFSRLKKYPPLAETIIFSAKESIYKCFFPLIEEFFDFSIVSIKLDFEQGSFYIFSTFPPIVKILEEKNLKVNLVKVTLILLPVQY